MTSVDRLRDQCIAQSQRPFLARGASLQRCPLCLLANHWCICQSQPEPSKDAAVALVFYQGEIFKPSNSGRLIADCMDENHAFLWQRRDCPKEFKHLIQRPDLQPFVIFPSEYSTPERCVQDKQSYDQLLGDRKPLFIFLDGSWREARKMFRGHWFDDLPVLSLFQQQLASYQLRRAVHDFQLGTADVATHIFRQLELTTLADRLDTYSQLVQQRYLAGKRNLLPNPTSDV